MMGSILSKIFGSHNDRELKRLYPILGHVNSHESSLSSLTDSELKSRTDQFRKRLGDGETLDQILPEAFAVVRETSKRVAGMRHFDVQIIGGIVLHEGKIAEMKTGEGKTLVATLSLYLNALTGRGAHLITVNDYLAKRDAQWMGPIYHFLGLSVGIIQHEASFIFDPSCIAPDPRLQYLRPVAKREAYNADITYGTNNEFGFDYLRDNMVIDISHCAQRELHYAIVDEVDSILIDEARTPLIISGPSEESTDKYYKINKIIPQLEGGTDHTIEEKTKTAMLTEEGNAKVERLLGIDNLYDLSNMDLVHHVVQALRAYTLFKRDVDYVVKDGEVIIVDEFTGRLMPGRRWSDGLHQAIEAKEGVRIAEENQTLATITFQNYFRLYEKLAGMTGTADTEAAEFNKIYNLDVVVIPPNRKMIRVYYPDLIYRTEMEKFNAVTEEITDLHKKGQPVLLGTISIEKSERLSSMLKKAGIKHTVLNAKYHEKEAEIIAQTGRMGSVTIATNMAGRGTDILLGGNPDFLFKRILKENEITPDEQKEEYEKIKKECEAEKEKVVSLGGLHIIGTERHESRRIDNQLRGRSGRQGDPGSSRFYLSLEDDLLRIFGSDRISGLMERLGMEEGIPIEHRMVTRAIENAQKKVEAHNFDIRKQLLEYDDVMNKQRVVIYKQRRSLLLGDGLRDEIFGMADDVTDKMVSACCNEDSYPDEWDLKGLTDVISGQLSVTIENIDELKDKGIDVIKEYIGKIVEATYSKKEEEIGQEVLRQIERMVMLRVIDSNWKDHLLSMDYLKEGIGLRGYGQKDPLIEYKREGFELFSDMIERIKSDAITNLFRIQKVSEPQKMASSVQRREQTWQTNRGDSPAQKTVHRDGKKTGRNDPCVCGSGKKYKKCCGV
jgi:preprotein translocase subunit SecA